MNWDILQSPIGKLVISVVLFAILTILALYVVERSVIAALKGLKFALKNELTSDTGRVNLLGAVLLAVVLVVFNLHEMVTEGLKVDGASKGDHVVVPCVLLGLFLLGSTICVLLLEKEK